MTHGEYATAIEAVLRDRGREDLIPDGGLDHWVAQGWTLDELKDADPDEGSDLWIEQVEQSEIGD